MKHRAVLTVGDIILMSSLLLSSVLLFLSPLLSERAASAQIVMAETGEVRVISLSKDAEYEVTSRGVNLTICVAEGEVFVAHSDCRDNICQNTPPISRGGQSIVCAPAGVVVRVVGEEVLVDGVSG